MWYNDSMKDYIEKLENSKAVNEVKFMNVISLAFIGDSLYSAFVRTHVLNKLEEKSKGLHSATSAYVKAKAQAAVYLQLEKAGYFCEEELGIAKRARNCKLNHTAKNASFEDYRLATMFESVLGYVFYTKDTERLIDMMMRAIEISDHEKVGK